MTIWSEHKIASALAINTFQRKAVVLVPNCYWTTRECDLLIVERRLRVIDVEIKISRADLKADANKDKWWHFLTWTEARDKDLLEPGKTWNPWDHKQRAEWPPKVWKHYYAVPAEIWDDNLLSTLPSEQSGVITLTMEEHGPGNQVSILPKVVRRATPNPKASQLTPAAVLDIARLANLRYWDARKDCDRARQLLDQMRLLQAGEVAA
jgi:TfoX/Sxy family transcriptional regulator of competence genes